MWREGGGGEWGGVRAVRRWVLTIIGQGVRDRAGGGGGEKGGGLHGEVVVSELAPGTREGYGPPLGMVTTTPSKVAIYREQAAAMEAAASCVRLPEPVG